MDALEGTNTTARDAAAFLAEGFNAAEIPGLAVIATEVLEDDFSLAHCQVLLDQLANLPSHQRGLEDLQWHLFHRFGKQEDQHQLFYDLLAPIPAAEESQDEEIEESQEELVTETTRSD